jgi:hypothetical protein
VAVAEPADPPPSRRFHDRRIDPRLGDRPITNKCPDTTNYQEAYCDHATQEARAETQEKFRQKCLNLSSGEEIADCFDDAVEAAREPQHSEEDLQAQKQMADRARLMLYVTFATGIMTFVVTVASVLLIRETLDLQRNATKSA